ncbi:hypothetical protein lacNasYZ03_04560 [Lactobacillus nasalidis]|uniref:Phage protein n=1 Tax=Lactobacillus nasalidis TaxID=2797258 RepID=A0ABQ3W4Z9_9LACO|nr:hypothetical protein [Lactobacillus nasalidis]GHV97267.1 hypothetical protein lacNasYZ01_04490 [Lactobacillus nasalidis]GHV99323.1 hypothetical protein lacNasYZ02_07530 [Lactobacillus nasalidis]GHW00769.1 hypothetical protein lacNasYZ03_04560 [Lactobacillus nasalidis]
MPKLSEARKKANKKWDDKNKARKNYIVKRSTAKGFILNLATEEDLDLLQTYINARRAALADQVKSGT